MKGAAWILVSVGFMMPGGASDGRIRLAREG